TVARLRTAPVRRSIDRSFAEFRLNAEPEQAAEARDQDGDERAPSRALDLFGSPPPAPQVLEIKPQFDSILFLDAERCQDGRDGAQHDLVDIVVVQPLLLCKNFRNDELGEL